MSRKNGFFGCFYISRVHLSWNTELNAHFTSAASSQFIFSLNTYESDKAVREPEI